MAMHIAHFITSGIHLAILVQHHFALACENGWTPEPRMKACFKLYRDIRLDWADAKRHCSHYGAYLTDMLDFTEQKFINDSLLKDHHIDYGVWLGATDRGKWYNLGKSVWKWVSGNKMNIHSFSWRKGNPDNGKVKVESKLAGENCLQMTTEPGYRGKLNDYYCDKKLPFVCKNKKMYTAITTPLIPESTTQQTSRKSNKPENSGNPETSVILISVLVSLVLISVAIIVTVILILKRRRKNLTASAINVYEVMADRSPNEHVYTGLSGTSGINNDASDGERPPIKTPPAYQLPQGQYSEPYLYDRPIENAISGSRGIGENRTSQQPGKCRQHERTSPLISSAGNSAKLKLTKRQNKGMKGQQLITTPSGYLDMDRHYEDIVDDYVMPPDSQIVKGSVMRKENGTETDDVNNYKLPPYYLTPKGETPFPKVKKVNV